MNLILTAHGTRRPSGVAMIADIAAQVSALVDRTVQVAFVDVLGPSPSEVLSALSCRPAIVVPAFLSRGYHVRTDLPAHVAASAHPHVTVTPALGPCREIAQIVTQQLVESGWRPGDSVILAAAGASDRRARADLHTTRTLVSELTGSWVDMGFAGTGGPDVRTAVQRARDRAEANRGARRGRLLPVGRRPFSRAAAGIRCRCGNPTARHPSGLGTAGREPISQRGSTSATAAPLAWHADTGDA
ncbi:hypothetical protein I105_03195 [Mycobacterium tuberculosis OFXR-2]|nr:hypothetical protein I105_03195 [Mycobacterium tuberculosis OFXR-2]